MQRCAVCLPLQGGRVLLGHKKTGFGAGKIVEIGGKIEPGETPADAARRELHEESGLIPEPLPAGEVRFEFEGRPEWNLHVHVFTARSWQGEPVETDEIRPEWFPVEALPYPGMWIDAPHWLPRVLRGERVHLRFVLDADGHTLRRVEPLGAPNTT